MSSLDGGITPATPARDTAAARRAIAALSLILVGTVAVVVYAGPGRHQGGAPGILPTLNAALNASAAVCLVTGWIFIRRKWVAAHRACMLVACAISTAFLVSYLMHHAQVGSVPFRGTGAVRALYLAILFPHIVLAAVIVPLALFTIYRGWTGRIAAHRRIARWTLPLWLYVSVSGVVIYFMLYRIGG
jgi:putative membrane protein